MNNENEYYGEHQNENQVKKNNNKKIWIILLVIVVLALVSYIVYDQVIANKDDEPDTQEVDKKDEPPASSKETLSLTDPLVLELSSSFIGTNENRNINSPLMIYYDYLFKLSKVTRDSFDHEQVFTYAWDKIDNAANADKENFELSDEAVDTAIKQLFGEDFEYLKKDTLTIYPYPNNQGWGGLELNYNKDTEVYSVINAGAGGKDVSGRFSLETELSEAYKEDDLLVITAKFVFIKVDVDSNGVGSYTVALDADLLNAIDDGTVAYENLETINLTKYLEQANEITLRFKLGANGNYYFLESNLAK